jgi:RHS repeat-associated protein
MKPRSSLFFAVVLLAGPVRGQPADAGPQPSTASATESPAVTVADADPSDFAPIEPSTDPSLPASAANLDTDIEFYHLDALGSVRMVTNRTGAVVARYDYLPFGEEVALWVGGRNQIPGYGGSSISRRFTGQERDVESGLDYFKARYYSGPHGRFTSPDRSERPQPIPNTHIHDPQSLNLYAYARNSPMVNVDADGRDWVSGLVGAAITMGFEAHRQVKSGRSMGYIELNTRLLLVGGVGFGVGALLPEILKSAPGAGVAVIELAILGGGSVAVKKVGEGIIEYTIEVANGRTERLRHVKVGPTLGQMAVGASATLAGGVVGSNLPSEASHAAEKGFETLGDLVIHREEEKQQAKDREERNPTPKPTPTPRTTEVYD